MTKSTKKNTKKKALVEVFAKEFHGPPIADASVTDLHSGKVWKTNASGYVGIESAPGEKLTLMFQGGKYPDVQTGTIIVPPKGLTGEDNEITFEVPSRGLYKALLFAFGGPKTGTRHVATTVLAAGSNLHHNFGEPGAKVYLVGTDGKRYENVLYLAAKSDGHGSHTTSWPSAILKRRLSQVFSAAARRVGESATTIDGGVLIPDVPYGEYKIVAEKKDANGNPVIFSEARVTVAEVSPKLINVSPPQGPRVAKP